MSNDHVVVDGSNIATEGRTAPSLKQLDEAVRAFLADHPHDILTVVVDATFGHRIAASERPKYEEAVLAGEIVSPPAGAIGRGDAFVLQIADKAGATVLSNDSFQEFHGQYQWLFDEGRLIGGKPVEHVGWVFLPRTPVRGPTSRKAVRAAKDRRGGTAPETRRAKAPATRRSSTGVDSEAAAPTASTTRARRSRKAAAEQPAVPAPKGPAADADPKADDAGRRGRGRGRGKPPEPVNEPVPFLSFVSDHAIGSTVEGVVDRFSSHGAYVHVGEAQCYVPLKSMGDPIPKSAREVLTLGESRTFVVQSFDTPRRGIDLALPGFESLEPRLDEDGATAATDTPQPAGDERAATAPAGTSTPTRRSTRVATKKAPAKAPAKKAPATRSPRRSA